MAERERFCARCGRGLFMQSKHYFEEDDGTLTTYCLACGVKRERSEKRRTNIGTTQGET